MAGPAPTPPDHLMDAQGRPYFLWDEDTRVEQFRERLRDPDPAVRAYYLGKLMRQAKPGRRLHVRHAARGRGTACGGGTLPWSQSCVLALDPRTLEGGAAWPSVSFRVCRSASSWCSPESSRLGPSAAVRRSR